MNNTATLAALESRLTKLERRNRLLLSCLVATVGIGVFTASKAVKESATFSEVRANQFVLVDDREREIGTWFPDKGKYPLLRMRSDIYGHSLELGEAETGNFLFLHNDSGAKVHLSSGPTGSGLQLYGQPGNGGYVSLLANQQTAGMRAFRQNRAEIRVSAGDFPIESYKPGGRERDFYFTRGSLNLNGLNLHLNDSKGNRIQTLPQRPLPQAVESPTKKPFSLFGPRR